MRMKVVPLLAILAVPFAASPAPARGAEILELIPAATPAFVLVKNPAKVEEDLQALFPSASKDAPPSFSGLLPRLLGFKGTLDGIDNSGPLLIAMPQIPFPLFATAVKDYDRFLASLRGDLSAGESAPPPPSPVPGMDMVLVSGKPLFLRKEGGFAFLSPMPLMLTPPAAGAGLAGIFSPEEKASLGESDIFFRLDVGTILTLVEPMLAPYLAAMETSLQGTPGESPTPSGQTPEEIRKLLKAETALLMAGLKQISSLSAGAAIREDDLLFSNLIRPLPASAFEQILGKMTPGTHEMLSYFDADAAWAGSFSLNPEAFAVMVPAMIDFMTNSGMYDLTVDDMEHWKSIVATALEVSGAESAFSFGSSRTSGAFSTLVVATMKDTERARGMMKESFLFAEKILAASRSTEELELEVEVQAREAVETYKGVPIDSFRISVAAPSGGEEKAREFDAVMESMFGGNSLGIWVAFVEDLMLASYYAPTSDELKGLIDRVREGKHGNLTASAAFRSATGTLPAQTLSLNYFSFPRFLSLITAMIGKIRHGEKLPPWPLKDEDLSGIGIAYSNPGGSLRMDTVLPRQEAENIRIIMDYLKSLEPDARKTTPL